MTYTAGVPIAEASDRILAWRELDIEHTGLMALASPSPSVQPAWVRAPNAVAEVDRAWNTDAEPSRRGRQRAQQDRERVIEMIKARIVKVMPLVYWDPAHKNQVMGRARVRFRMDVHGYVDEAELLEVQGRLDLHDATHSVLHLAEPYVYVPGWIVLDLAFSG